MTTVMPARAGIQFLFALASVLPGLAAAGNVTEVAAGSVMPVADRIVIEKGRHTLSLYAHGQRLVSFSVALGRRPVGRKVCQGDDRTPEGYYFVSGRKDDSDFHRALRISYPSPEDRARAELTGCDPGGDIMIHGLKQDWGADSRFHVLHDWTKGCVAVTNEEIERIWRMVPDGAEVEIKP